MFLLVVNEAHGMSGVGSRFNIVSRTVSFGHFMCSYMQNSF